MNINQTIKDSGIIVQDFVRKTNILSTTNFLLESQKWSGDQMYSYRLNKLQHLVHYSYKYVPYYTELFNSHGISPLDIKTLEDIKKIPILTKETARANQHKLISFDENCRHIKKGKTGGTTGVPLLIFKDAADRSFTWASYYRWYTWIGIGKEEKSVTLWGSRTVLKQSLRHKITDSFTNWIQNNKTICSFGMNKDNLHEVYSQIQKFNPVLIKGYVSAVIFLAEYMRENNLPPNRNLRALSTTSETLLPMFRDLLQSVFSVPVYDQYGCGEVSAISYECAKHGGLHINEEHVYIESLDENDNDSINKKGRLIVTSLDNLVMPFIRFENGDVATLHSGKCTCGVNSQLMSSIDGRVADTITLKDGSKVHGVFFTDLLHEMGITTDLINRFQICQHKTGAIDFLLETEKVLPKNVISELETKTLLFINDVNILPVKHIPDEENGKFKYIKTGLP
jgi:phenylacetate-CoA ligase